MPPRSPSSKEHALECFAVDSLNPVVSCQRTIQEGKLSVDELENAPVLAHHRRHEHQRLAAHGIEQFVVHRGEALRIGFLAIEQAKVQPLGGEVIGQGVGLGVVEHSPDLSFENARLAQRAPVSRLQQRVVRHAAPEKIGEPRGQFVIVQPVRARDAHRITFDAEQEIRRHQHGLQADAHSFFQAVALLLRQRHQFQQGLQLAFGGRPAVRPVRQILHDAARALRIVTARWVAANEDAPVALGRRARRLVGSHDIHVIDEDFAPAVAIDVNARIVEIGEFREGCAQKMIARRHRHADDGLAARVVVIRAAFHYRREHLPAIDGEHHLYRRR